MSDILVATSGGVCRVQFNRPAKKNALTLAMYDEFTAALRDASATKTTRVVLVTGAGNCFTSGNDIADFMQSPPSSLDSPVGRFLKALIEFDKPLIAGVQGIAVGIGTTLLLHCDLVYASDDAQFQLPFVNLGIVPEAASSYLLPRMLGFARAGELLLHGERFDVNVANELGLISRVVPRAEFEAFLEERTRAIAAKPPGALRQTKDLMRRWTRDAVARAMTEEGEIFLKRLTGPEAAEAFGAFVMKRTPDFSAFE